MAESRFEVQGLKQVQAAFKKAPELAKQHLADATEMATVRILSGARQRVAPHRRYGFLERYLTRSMSRTTGEGRVGLPRVAAVIPGGASGSGPVTQKIRRKGKTTFHVYGSGSAKGARTVYPSKYAHLVEFGHRRGSGKSAAPAYPFMIPAAEAAKAPYLNDCRTAGQKVERDLSVSRFL